MEKLDIKKELKEKVIIAICSTIFVILFILIPNIYLDDVSRYDTYIGENGLKKALLLILATIPEKLSYGIILGILISLIVKIIKVYKPYKNYNTGNEEK